MLIKQVICLISMMCSLPGFGSSPQGSPSLKSHPSLIRVRSKGEGSFSRSLSGSRPYRPSSRCSPQIVPMQAAVPAAASIDQGRIEQITKEIEEINSSIRALKLKRGKDSSLFSFVDIQENKIAELKKKLSPFGRMMLQKNLLENMEVNPKELRYIEEQESSTDRQIQSEISTLRKKTDEYIHRFGFQDTTYGPAKIKEYYDLRNRRESLKSQLEKEKANK